MTAPETPPTPALPAGLPESERLVEQIRLAGASIFFVIMATLGLTGMESPRICVPGVVVAAVLGLTAGLSLLQHHRSRPKPWAAYVAVTIDVIALSAVGVIAGGVQSTIPTLYLIVIAFNSLRRARGPLLYTAVLTTLGFCALAHFGEGQISTPRMINLVASQWVMVLVALGGVRLARQLTEVALRQQQEQLLLRQAVGRYFSPQVSRLMIEQPDRLRSQRRDVTALFADLSGFTHLAEHEPEQVVLETLDAYLGALVDVAQKHSGTIDNYLGDALLVVFNAPIDQPDHGSLALACAREMQEVVFNMGLSRSRQGKPYLALVVGINSGRATAGNIGGKARLQYTVIGDAVNVAARLEGLGLPGEIIVGLSTAQAAGIDLSGAESRFVRGREAQVRFVRIPSAHGLPGAAQNDDDELMQWTRQRKPLKRP